MTPIEPYEEMDRSGTVLHQCDHGEHHAGKHQCKCALDRDHTADEYDTWLGLDEGDPRWGEPVKEG